MVDLWRVNVQSGIQKIKYNRMFNLPLSQMIWTWSAWSVLDLLDPHDLLPNSNEVGSTQSEKIASEDKMWCRRRFKSLSLIIPRVGIVTKVPTLVSGFVMSDRHWHVISQRPKALYHVYSSYNLFVPHLILFFVHILYFSLKIFVILCRDLVYRQKEETRRRVR